METLFGMRLTARGRFVFGTLRNLAALVILTVAVFGPLLLASWLGDLAADWAKAVFG